EQRNAATRTGPRPRAVLDRGLQAAARRARQPCPHDRGPRRARPDQRPASPARHLQLTTISWGGEYGRRGSSDLGGRHGFGRPLPDLNHFLTALRPMARRVNPAALNAKMYRHFAVVTVCLTGA